MPLLFQNSQISRPFPFLTTHHYTLWDIPPPALSTPSFVCPPLVFSFPDCNLRVIFWFPSVRSCPAHTCASGFFVGPVASDLEKMF